MKKSAALILVLVSLFAFAGCGDDDESGINPGTPCEALIFDICESACACSDDCAWSVDGMASSSTDFETCYQLEMTFGTCDGLEMDFDACSAALTDGECAENAMENQFQLPEVCNDLSGF